tara:strand:+ start:3665 stop:4840 length:1176 start_codon:yes stop_codon:yes gene_type:complete
MSLSQRIQAIKPSPTIAISGKARELKAQGRDILALSAGEPDFDTPDVIKQTAIEAINNGDTKYTNVDGTPALKQATIHKFKRDNGLDYEPNQILVSAGAKHSIFNALIALIDPDDEVIIPAPYWVSYPDMVILMGGKPVILDSDIDKHFKITPAQLEAAITPKTKMVLFNSPSNPSGAAYTKAELKALGEVLLKHPHVLALTDDIYEHIWWADEPFCNIVMACPDLYDRTIVVNGVSKAYAMTGWRIGVAAGPAKIIAAMKKAQSQSTSNPCSVSQAAAATAFNCELSLIEPMVEAFKQRHDYIVSSLNGIEGIRCRPAEGTFYAFFDVTGVLKKLGMADDLALADYLLDKAEIALIPGSAFGCNGYLRMSFATSMDVLEQAIARLQKALG